MNNVAVKIAVIESESGWGQKVDDYMVCLTVEDAQKFKREFNAKNNESKVPAWYMYCDDATHPIDLTPKQMRKLKSTTEKRMWWSSLKEIK